MTVKSLNALLMTKASELSEEEIGQIVDHYRKQRAAFAVEEREKKGKKEAKKEGMFSSLSVDLTSLV